MTLPSCGACPDPIEVKGGCYCGECFQVGSVNLCYAYSGEYVKCASRRGSTTYVCVARMSMGMFMDPVEEVIITDKAEYVQELMEGFSLCGSW